MFVRTLVGSTTLMALLILSAAAPAQPTQAERIPGVQPFNPGGLGLGDSLRDELVGAVLARDAMTEAGEDLDLDAIARRGDQIFAIVSVGGFLGMGDRDVAVPLEEFTVQEQGLVLQGYTQEQLEELPELNEADYERIPEDTIIRDVIASR